MWTLGINAPPVGWHDAAACLIDGDGAVVAFVEEERLSRRRHSLNRGPAQAAAFCLRSAALVPSDIQVIAIGWDIEWMYPGRFADLSELVLDMLGWEVDDPPEVIAVPHHLAHATCAFYSSGYREAGVLVVDGNGEREATTIWHFKKGREPSLRRTWDTSRSIGYAYDAASRWLGFSLFEAGKTMGLAAYGRADRMQVPALVSFEDGDYRLRVGTERWSAPRNGQELGQQYKQVTRAWRRVFGEIAGADKPSESVDRLHRDPGALRVAYSAQVLVEESVKWLAREARAETGVPELCFAGGVALNCSANGLLASPVYVPPIPHDAGVALGAAWHLCPPQRSEGPLDPYLGPTPGCAPASELLTERGLIRVDFDPDTVAGLLDDGQVGAVVEGRAEIGPRALCRRSIISLPRPAELHERLNEIKHRDPWRPFGPAADADVAGSLWDIQPMLSRYMLGATKVTEKGREVAPAIVHVDGTTRPQIVRGDDAPAAAAVLDSLARRGLPPVLVNTSFNDRGQPIVSSAADAISTFLALNLDFLVLGDQVLRKRG